MKNKIKTSLNRAIDQLPHPDAQEVWELPVIKMTEHDYMTRQEKPKPVWSRQGARAFAAAAACLMMAVAGGGTLHYQNQVIRTVVDIDINPSIEINLNRKSKVVSATGLNREAEALLESIQIKGEDAGTAVETIMLEAKAQQYFVQRENAVLLSVSTKNENSAAQLEEELSRQVRIAVDREDTPVTVVSQYFDRNDKKLQDVSHEYHISTGKAALIEKLKTLNPAYTPEQLASLSAEELLGLLRETKSPLPGQVKVDSSAWLSQEAAAPAEEETESETEAPKESAAPVTEPPAAETQPKAKAPVPTTPHIPAPSPERYDDDRDDEADDEADDQADDEADDQDDGSDNMDDQDDDFDDADDQNDDFDDADDQDDQDDQDDDSDDD